MPMTGSGCRPLGDQPNDWHQREPLSAPSVDRHLSFALSRKRASETRLLSGLWLRFRDVFAPNGSPQGKVPGMQNGSTEDASTLGQSVDRVVVPVWFSVVHFDKTTQPVRKADRFLGTLFLCCHIADHRAAPDLRDVVSQELQAGRRGIAPLT